MVPLETVRFQLEPNVECYLAATPSKVRAIVTITRNGIVMESIKRTYPAWVLPSEIAEMLADDVSAVLPTPLAQKQ